MSSDWNKQVIRIGSNHWSEDEAPDITNHSDVEPWLSALFQADHLNLLLGSGFTTAVTLESGGTAAEMSTSDSNLEFTDQVNEIAKQLAVSAGRGEANFEDQLRAARQLVDGLRVLSAIEDTEKKEEKSSATNTAKKASELLEIWEKWIGEALLGFASSVLISEADIKKCLVDRSSEQSIKKANEVRALIGSFLLAFSSRTASRERLHVFTTNYDRLFEYSCEMLGIRLIDRFVGTLNPIFQSSRLGIDLHYNPPGIRGEPRYLEGVVRFSKLHGSLDWRDQVGGSGRRQVERQPLAFGGSNLEIDAKEAMDSLMIYPNPAKDVETLEYPYADLFRDFAAAVSRPNSVLVTYGYGFGDDHINRILADMLLIPSTHMVIISYDDPGNRIQRFIEQVGRDEQISVLVGPDVGSLASLTVNYLPKPAIDRNTLRMVELLRNRDRPESENQQIQEGLEGSTL